MAMLKNAFLSGIAGFICSLFLSELFVNPMIIILVSGIGGFFGIRGLTFILQNKINSDILKNEDFINIFGEAFNLQTPTDNIPDTNNTIENNTKNFNTDSNIQYDKVTDKDKQYVNIQIKNCKSTYNLVALENVNNYINLIHFYQNGDSFLLPHINKQNIMLHSIMQANREAAKKK